MRLVTSTAGAKSLLDAIACNSIELVEMLLNAGATVGEGDHRPDKFSDVLLAARGGQSEILRCLLLAGACAARRGLRRDRGHAHGLDRRRVAVAARTSTCPSST